MKIILCEPRPPIVEVVQFVGKWEEKLEIANWVAQTMPWISAEQLEGGFVSPGIYWGDGFYEKLIFKTWVGAVIAEDGDWLVKDSSGNFTVLSTESLNQTWREIK